MVDDCLFCKIIAGEIPSNMVYEDDLCYAFHDINPTAPVHVLIIPKSHIASCNQVTELETELIGHIFAVAAKIAKEMGLDKTGYRIVNNCGEGAGQTVFHIHFHLIGGRELLWPAG